MTIRHMFNDVMKKRLVEVIIEPETSISESIEILDHSGMGVLLVSDNKRKLLGVITDGDIRRAMMRNVPLTSKCKVIANMNPVTARDSITKEEALHKMDHSKSFIINHLPLVDQNCTLTGLLLRSDLTSQNDLELSAVIMAGGFGTRLRPLTEELPKPMLSVGDRPILETVVSQLCAVGIKQIQVTTHYKPEIIYDHFGDGSKYGVDISYVKEKQPMGTAGALRLMKPPDGPFLVINGDVLSKVNFEAMFMFHKECGAQMTVGVRRQEFKLPYGVVKCNNIKIISLEEKPVLSFLVNAGIYLLEPHVIEFIPQDVTFHMTDLIQVLLEEKLIVASFPIHEYWMDIGRHLDYEKANSEYKRNFDLHK